MPVLSSRGEGQVDPTRDYVVVGRERHVDNARTDQLPYPQRAIRTKDYLYIRNFKPDRWPMGTAPAYGEPDEQLPSSNEIENETRLLFRDMDAGPTKAWLIENRSQPEIAPFFNIAFGQRPAEELYDLKSDPHQMQNVAEQPMYRSARQQMSDRLMTILRETQDPRVIGSGTTFDQPPYAGPIEAQSQKRKPGAN
jgi:uncharacterized sulfatase